MNIYFSAMEKCKQLLHNYSQECYMVLRGSSQSNYLQSHNRCNSFSGKETGGGGGEIQENRKTTDKRARVANSDDERSGEHFFPSVKRTLDGLLGLLGHPLLLLSITVLTEHDSEGSPSFFTQINERIKFQVKH